MTLDELVPAAGLGVFFFMSGCMATAVIASAVSVGFIRLMKRGRGVSWLLDACYWYLPGVVSLILIGNTPPSKNREYIS